MNKYRAVYFDVDGTLVDSQRRLHPATVATLHALGDLGIRRGLATGRAFPSAAPYARALAADAPLVLYNGARVVEPASGAVLAARDLPLEHARRALELAAAHDLHVNCYLHDRLYVARLGRRAKASVAKDGLDAEPVGDLLAFLERDPVKLLLIGLAPACDAFKAALEAACAGLPAPPLVVRSEPEYVEVLGHGAHKGSGLLRACAAAGLEPAQVVAFGDGLNDLELLEAAGLGVAMGNAHPEVRARAERVIGHHDTDALAVALAEIFDLL